MIVKGSVKDKLRVKILKKKPTDMWKVFDHFTPFLLCKKINSGPLEGWTKRQICGHILFYQCIDISKKQFNFEVILCGTAVYVSQSNMAISLIW